MNLLITTVRETCSNCVCVAFPIVHMNICVIKNVYAYMCRISTSQLPQLSLCHCGIKHPQHLQCILHRGSSASSTDNEVAAPNSTDVSIASVEQLCSLTASKLCSHLKRCLLPTSGNKVMMATYSHQYFRTSINMA